MKALSRLIVVDDDKNMLITMRAVLESYGYICETFQNPHHAIEAMKHASFYALLTDYCMPEMEGWEVARLAKEHQIKKVICISGSYVQQDHKKFFDHRLRKPFNIEELMQVLKMD